MRSAGLIVFGVAGLVASCKKPTPPAPTAGSGSAPAVTRATYQLEETIVSYGVALPPGADVDALLRLAKTTAPSTTAEAIALSSMFSSEQIPRLVRRLATGDADAVKSTANVIALSATPTGAKAPTIAREAAGAAKAIAQASHGWVVDPATIQSFTAADFEPHIPGRTPDARTAILVRSYGGSNELPFLDTAGMRRLGYPELYVAETASGDLAGVVDMVQAAAQHLLSTRDVEEGSSIPIDFAALGWDESNAKPANADCRWTTRLTREPDSTADDFDVIELLPPTGVGVEGITALLDACFVHRPDTVIQLAVDDPELLATGEHARKDLLKLRAHFKKGVPPDERFTVKARFTDGDKAEWMWVDVVSYSGSTFKGTLDNVPETVTSLHDGQKLTVKFADVADYMHEHDGTTDGGYSVELMKQRGLYRE